eukprot:TRINITY_DN362_c0_g1_i2.p1 TRINITY_DN362_c0_g1~~TRINITY_DN362_c0_g1_i2.p1  ORF type:complete len:275 (-),score=42.35 TRINITY_DN362_c0_g1_i2:52-876(-)
MVDYLSTTRLLSYIWGFEVLNEPVTSSASDLGFLKSFTESVVNSVLAPRMSHNQVVVLQPGPANDKIAAYEAYNLLSNVTYIFDLHEYICFSNPLYLTTMEDVIASVKSSFGDDRGITKWQYFVGEWSMASTDCAEYLNGAWGGFDPNYYKNQHQNRNTFMCNKIDQVRGGELAGFQTCSSIVGVDMNVAWGHCSTAGREVEYKTYKESMCNLFSTYINAITSNTKNIGFSFWTYLTGDNQRRIQQWDFSWLVENGIISNLANPPTPEECKAKF